MSLGFFSELRKRCMEFMQFPIFRSRKRSARAAMQVSNIVCQPRAGRLREQCDTISLPKPQHHTPAMLYLPYSHRFLLSHCPKWSSSLCR